jgi:type IV secretory pathway VirB6-like protein
MDNASSVLKISFWELFNDIIFLYLNKIYLLYNFISKFWNTPKMNVKLVQNDPLNSQKWKGTIVMIIRVKKFTNWIIMILFLITTSILDMITIPIMTIIQIMIITSITPI